MHGKRKYAADLQIPAGCLQLLTCGGLVSEALLAELRNHRCTSCTFRALPLPLSLQLPSSLPQALLLLFHFLSLSLQLLQLPL